MFEVVSIAAPGIETLDDEVSADDELSATVLGTHWSAVQQGETGGSAGRLQQGATTDHSSDSWHRFVVRVHFPLPRSP